MEQKKRRTLLCLLAALILFAVFFLFGRGGGKDNNAKDPMTWQEQYELGIRLLNEGDYEDAVLAFQTAIQIDAKHANAYLGLAEGYLAMGDEQAAANGLRQGKQTLGDDWHSQVAGLIGEFSEELNDFYENGNWDIQEDSSPEREESTVSQPETEKDEAEKIETEKDTGDGTEHVQQSVLTYAVDVLGMNQKDVVSRSGEPDTFILAEDGIMYLCYEDHYAQLGFLVEEWKETLDQYEDGPIVIMCFGAGFVYYAGQNSLGDFHVAEGLRSNMTLTELSDAAFQQGYDVTAYLSESEYEPTHLVIENEEWVIDLYWYHSYYDGDRMINIPVEVDPNRSAPNGIAIQGK